MPSPRWIACDRCRAFVAPSSRVCEYCGAPIGGRRAAKVSEPPPGPAAPHTAWQAFPVTVGWSIALAAIFAAQLMVQTAVLGQPLRVTGLMGVFNPSWNVHALFGGMIPPGAPWWTWFLTNFLHNGGLVHLAFNVYAFSLLGRRAELAFGRPFTFFLIAFAGGPTSVFAVWAQPAFHAGFSGILCALLGAVLVHARRIGDALFYELAVRWTVLIAILSLLPGISWAGHLGGFAVGLASGWIWMQPGLRRLRRPRAARVLAVLAAALLVACVALQARSVFLGWRHREFFEMDRALVRITNEAPRGTQDADWVRAAISDLRALDPLPPEWSRIREEVLEALRAAPGASARASALRVTEAARPWFELRDEVEVGLVRSFRPPPE